MKGARSNGRMDYLHRARVRRVALKRDLNAAAALLAQ